MIKIALYFFNMTISEVEEFLFENSVHSAAEAIGVSETEFSGWLQIYKGA